MKPLIILCCIFSFFSSKPDYVVSSKKATKDVSQVLEKQYDVSLLNGGGYYKGEKVAMLYMDLKSRASMTKNEAQKVVVSCIYTFLKQANANLKLKKHLLKNELSKNDISLSMIFYNKHNQIDPDLAKVEYRQGDLIFFCYDVATKKFLPFISESI